MFLVFEGIDGSGTTTQVQRLANALADMGHAVIQTAEPTDAFLGKTIRSVLSGNKRVSPKALQLLFFADRQHHLDTVIVPALHEKKIVLSDRYKVSSVAYAALSGDEAFFQKLADDFLEPDYTIFLDIDAETAFRRVHARGEKKEIFEALQAQKTVAEAYRRAIARIPQEKKLVIDATQTKEKIADKVLDAVLRQRKK